MFPPLLPPAGVGLFGWSIFFDSAYWVHLSDLSHPLRESELVGQRFCLAALLLFFVPALILFTSLFLLFHPLPLSVVAFVALVGCGRFRFPLFLFSSFPFAGRLLLVFFDGSFYL